MGVKKSLAIARLLQEVLPEESPDSPDYERVDDEGKAAP
jgi:hypothetical protein